MWFEDVDVYPASVPNKQLASLASCRARNVGITEIFYFDLSPILDVDSVNYQVSRVEYQQPDSERCEVELGGRGELRLDMDITALAQQYNGQVKLAEFFKDYSDRYRAEG